jgi:hypothetical protein
MRHAVIKTTNFLNVILLGLLLVYMPRTVDPDLAPVETITFVSSASETLYVSRVTPVDKKVHRVWRVEWSDGVKQTLWPCKFEDSRHCYWDAGIAGNGYGDSFVMSRREVWFLNAYAL